MPIERPGGQARFLDLDFDLLPFEGALAETLKLSRGTALTYIVTPNVDHVVQLESGATPAFNAAYDDATFRVCDSRILARLARLCGLSLTIVPGSDLVAALFDRGFQPEDRVAIVGGGEDMLDRLTARFPLLTFIQHVPPMGLLAKPEAIRAVEAFVECSQAHYVLFAIGSPRSEIIAHRCQQNGTAGGVALCIGASVEFILGDQARAPRWMRSAGLEWAFRLVTNPGRLWRRYLVEGPKIFLITAKWYLRTKSGTSRKLGGGR
jgi:N-acetylglucosaminyldiphosphoundecaprenol N-acetyl-beta-D-mannosaminyltransferase